jgi:hypothetical protein
MRRKLITDDDLALLVDEQDGGPLCREATIASWKGKPPVHKEKMDRKRNIHWLAGVIRREGA